MKKFLLLALILFSNIYCKTTFVDWLVVGGGPAGIVTIGVLLDIGIPQEKILWIDPEFNVGRLTTYENVPANTKNKLFIKFFEMCKTFHNCQSKAIEDLKLLDPEKEFNLATIVEPLKDITVFLRDKVKNIQTSMSTLYFENNRWQVMTKEGYKISAYQVVLATGSKPKALNCSTNITEIPLDLALDKNKLENLVCPEDTIAVVGSAHSAILILKYLSELNVKKIINFYNKPLMYAEDMGTWVLHNGPGLKGATAEWAKNVLEKNPPANLVRLESKSEILKDTLPTCDKIIYAIGYEKNDLPKIKENPSLEYDPSTGVIAPRLFGIGIAFPEQYTDPIGNVEYRVGLNSFMEYAQRIVPFWANQRSMKRYKEQRKLLEMFEELFTIEVL